MDTQAHTLPALFAQLGLPNDLEGISTFIHTHQIRSNVELQKASFWSSAQASFLAEALQEDSDWAEVVDELNMRLHEH